METEGKRISMSRFVARNVARMRPSGIRRYFDIAASMDDVITLGIGEPDFTTPEHIITRGIDSLRAGATGYTSNSGMPELRQAISGYIARLYGLHYSPESEVLVTVGVSEALFLALKAILDPEDEVLVVEPCFVANAAAVEMAGGVAVTIPTTAANGFQVTDPTLEAAVTARTKAILISYPNNPTGAVLDLEHLQQVADVAERHDLIVISDEIYERLVYDTAHICFGSLPGMKARTILLSGVSKSFAMTGWRIGYATAPPEIMDAMKKLHQYLIMSAPTIGQYAAIEALQHGETDVNRMRNSYDQRRRLIVDSFNAIGLPCRMPQGAFYAFPSVASTGLSDEEFCELLLHEARVAVIPGSAFGESGRGHVRASYTASTASIERALELMAQFVARHGLAVTTSNGVPLTH
jgi:aminotransferase